MRRLKSQAGATILMALLLMALAIMVSTTAFASAMAAVKTTSNDREYRQQYLTVSSAANIVREELEKCQSRTGTDSFSTKTDSMLGAMLDYLTEQSGAFNNNPTAKYSKSQSFSLTPTGEEALDCTAEISWPTEEDFIIKIVVGQGLDSAVRIRAEGSIKSTGTDSVKLTIDMESITLKMNGMEGVTSETTE